MPEIRSHSIKARRRLSEIDLVELARPLPAGLTQLTVVGILIVATVFVRWAIDVMSPGAGPFAVTMPAVLIATLFARWQAGVLCQLFLSLHAWYFVLPELRSWDFVNDGDGPRVVVNMLAGYVIVAFAELFRRRVRTAVNDREMFMRELEHRVKNSFANVAGVLRLQQAKAEEPETREALQVALGRVESFARAYDFLARSSVGIGQVDIADYLTKLCSALEEAAGDESNVRFECNASTSMVVDRDRASTIGLLVNEVVTNSLKHAFGEHSAGRITVSFERTEDGRVLSVEDDGRGMPSESSGKSGLGLRLIERLAQQAQAAVDVDSGPHGTQFSFVFPD